MKSVNSNPFIQDSGVRKTKSFLIYLSLALLMINITVILSTKQFVNDNYSEKDQATWHLLQLQKEFTQLVTISPFALNSEKVLAEVKIQYDITWSRIDLIRTSTESREFYSRAKSKQFFDKLYLDYQLLDEHLQQLHDEPSLAIFVQSLDEVYNNLVNYLHRNHKLKNSDFLYQLQKANQLANIQVLLVFVLCFCIALVVYLFKKEAILHRTLAFTDSLTGLGNRLSLFKRLNQRVQRDSHFSLFILDLNGFKLINDTYGHQAGDVVLSTTSERLMMMLDGYDANLFRMGGDEFAIILDSVDVESIEEVRLLVLRCLQNKIKVDQETDVEVSSSIGLALFPDDTCDLNQLIKTADDNMYKMKQLNS